MADAQDKQCFTLLCHWYRTIPSLPSKNASTTLALMHIIVPLQLAYPISYGATVHSATHRPLFSTLCLRATSPTVTEPIVPTHSKYPSHLLAREHSGPAGQCCLALPCRPQPTSCLSSTPFAWRCPSSAPTTAETNTSSCPSSSLPSYRFRMHGAPSSTNTPVCHIDHTTTLVVMAYRPCPY